MPNPLPKDFERRHYSVELRAEDDAPVLVGHAAVFNSLSEEMWGFRERIEKGAFRKTIQEADVRALFNHDPNFVLGRTKAKTLELSEDETGLLTRITPPDTQWATDLVKSIKRGDIDQMSFGFKVIKDEWEEDFDTEPPMFTRTLKEVRLYDVSPVTFPAYSDTDVSVRAIDKVKELSHRVVAPTAQETGANHAQQPENHATQLRRLRLEMARRLL